MFENRLHEKAPFGVVSSAWKVTANVVGKIREFSSKYTLTGTSENAVSELPNRSDCRNQRADAASLSLQLLTDRLLRAVSETGFHCDRPEH